MPGACGGDCAELLAGKYRRIHPAFSTSSLNMTGRPSILLKPWSGQCCYVNCCRGITPCKIWLTGCVWHSAAPLFRLCWGVLVVLLTPGDDPLRAFLIWVLSESIGALALVPLGLLFKPHYLLRHRNPRLLFESLLTLAITLTLSWLSMLYLPWPFTFIIVLLMWSAVRLPRMEAF